MTELPDWLKTPQPLPREQRDGTFPYERFWSKVDKDSKLGPWGNCWEFSETSRYSGGYGAFWNNGKTRTAHRFAWEHKYGPIPEGFILLHRCDNPPCVRVDPNGPFEDDHFYVGTLKENNTDRDAKGRGIALSGEANANVKLNADHVREIRRLASVLKQQDIADKFGITQAAVSRIIRRQTWTNIE
jgi:predicted XRE-type DNA-binding protein